MTTPTLIVYSAAEVRQERWNLMRQANMPVWQLRQLADGWQLSPELQAVLASIDEFDFLSSGDDPVDAALIACAPHVDGEAVRHARYIRADFAAAGAPVAGASAADSDLVLTWSNGAQVVLSDLEFSITASGVTTAGDLDDVHETLEKHADKFGVTQYRPDTDSEKVARIRALYEVACERTIAGCSDELELFLADLSEALHA